MKTVLTFFILILLVQLISAQKPGTIDLAYGLNDSGSATVNDILFSKTSTLQPDNKFLLGGYDPVSTKYCLFRQTQDGLPDSSFGDNGKVYTTSEGLFRDTLYMNGWVSIAVQPDKKIVAAGDAIHYDINVQGEWGGPWNDDIIVARFLPDGTPDMSFGIQGRVFTDLGLIEYVKAVVIQPDGKILAAGFQDENSDGDGSKLLLVRYNANGTLDKSFGNGAGYFIYAATNSVANTVVLQPDGKIVTGGAVSATMAFLTMRFNINGSVDSSFGNNGQVVTSFKTGGALGTNISSIILDKKRRITVVGATKNYDNGQVVRYLSNGSLDSSFNGTGKLQLNKYGFSFLYPSEILLQPNNKMVISGYTWTSSTSKFLTQTALNEDGSVDTSFGTNSGYTLIPVSDGIYRTYSNSFTQSDGKIVTSYTGYVGLTNDVYSTTVRFYGYSTQNSWIVKIKRWLEHHGITWQDVQDATNYAVQRSSDGVNWTTIYSEKKITENYTTQIDRSFNDPSPLSGINYYRLQAGFNNGRIIYSNIIKINADKKAIILSPNPAINNLHIEGLTANNAKLTIIDFAGNIKLRQQTTSTTADLNISVLQPGNYLLKIETGNETTTKAFIKQ
ncbi:MAG: T9SS type A sorting domain-containing protein [Parafilimonas sp.]